MLGRKPDNETALRGLRELERRNDPFIAADLLVGAGGAYA